MDSFKDLMTKLGAKEPALNELMEKGITSLDDLIDIDEAKVEEQLPDKRIRKIWKNITGDLCNLIDGDLYENVNSRYAEFKLPQAVCCDAAGFMDNEPTPAKAVTARADPVLKPITKDKSHVEADNKALHAPVQVTVE